jgi:hypothetical protein
MKNSTKMFLAACLLTVFAFSVHAQSVGINADGSAPNGSAMLDVSSTSKGFLPPRMTKAQRDAIISPAPANGLLVYQTDNTPGYYYYNGAAWAALAGSGGVSHYIGELFGGGIVFWVDNTGQHGLIVSLVDMSKTSSWSNITALIGTTAQSSWNGQGNSTAIMGQSGHTGSAAQLCDDYTNAEYNTGIYSDWYLPAIDELSLIYHTKYILNKNIETAPAPADILSDQAYYWSSTESTLYTDWAWYFSFNDGFIWQYPKSNETWVRAIRAF